MSILYIYFNLLNYHTYISMTTVPSVNCVLAKSPMKQDKNFERENAINLIQILCQSNICFISLSRRITVLLSLELRSRDRRTVILLERLIKQIFDWHSTCIAYY